MARAKDKRSVRWSARARSDLEDALFIARDNPKAAKNWMAQLRKAADRAARLPRAGRIVPEINDDNVREVFLRSYRIVYGVRDDHILVLTVFGGGKHLEGSEVVS